MSAQTIKVTRDTPHGRIEYLSTPEAEEARIEKEKKTGKIFMGSYRKFVDPETPEEYNKRILLGIDENREWRAKNLAREQRENERLKRNSTATTPTAPGKPPITGVVKPSTATESEGKAALDEINQIKVKENTRRLREHIDAEAAKGRTISIAQAASEIKLLKGNIYE